MKDHRPAPLNATEGSDIFVRRAARLDTLRRMAASGGYELTQKLDGAWSLVAEDTAATPLLGSRGSLDDIAAFLHARTFQR